MYDHFIALDWAQSNMAIARMTRKSKKIHVVDTRSDIRNLIDYLKRLRGRTILTFEETTTAQWLYTELRNFVDEILVCDPYRNRLLLEGPKNDKIDASKLVRLLRLGELKPVYHSSEHFVCFRKLVSGHEDVVKAFVRATNQKSSLFRAIGKDKKKEAIEAGPEKFVLDGLDATIKKLKEDRIRYENEFSRLCKQHKLLSNLKSIPMIGKISAVIIAARIVNIKRFKTIGRFWSYCGLITFEKLSGGRSYGKRAPRYSRVMKTIICSAANRAIIENRNNVLKDRYEYLIREKNYSEAQAIIAIRRLLASIIFGVMRSGKKFNPKKFRYVTKTK